MKELIEHAGKIIIDQETNDFSLKHLGSCLTIVRHTHIKAIYDVMGLWLVMAYIYTRNYRFLFTLCSLSAIANGFQEHYVMKDSEDLFWFIESV